MPPDDDISLRETVRSHYAAAATAMAAGRGSGCCGSQCCGPSADGDAGPAGSTCGEPSYDDADRSVSAAAAATSLGMGNPTRVADLRPGEVVLDLGSGAGLDALISARKVGPGGRVIGLDMTDEMRELAERHAAQAGATNVEFVAGTIEAIPLPDASVDVVLSNCVINLSPDKAAVFRESHRVLRPGGRFVAVDVVADDGLSPADRAARGTTVGCIAGALSAAEFTLGLRASGFRAESVTVTHRVADGMHSAVVRAVKPAPPDPPGS